ncbi:MAG: hypothetical protein GY679_01405 [Mycoplasma sp.]|nr:hypothetical protein [Mycoplasma sp.]
MLVVLKSDSFGALETIENYFDIKKVCRGMLNNNLKSKDVFCKVNSHKCCCQKIAVKNKLEDFKDCINCPNFQVVEYNIDIIERESVSLSYLCYSDYSSIKVLYYDKKELMC